MWTWSIGNRKLHGFSILARIPPSLFQCSPSVKQHTVENFELEKDDVVVGLFFFFFVVVVVFFSPPVFWDPGEGIFVFLQDMCQVQRLFPVSRAHYLYVGRILELWTEGWYTVEFQVLVLQIFFNLFTDWKSAWHKERGMQSPILPKLNSWNNPFLPQES